MYFHFSIFILLISLENLIYQARSGYTPLIAVLRSLKAGG